MYHWCPGDRWDNGWGFNWDWNRCHDDHHADADGWNHDHDYWGDQRRDDRDGPGQWQGQHGDRGWQGQPGDHGDHR